MAATSPFPDVVVVMSGHLHLTASQVAGGGVQSCEISVSKNDRFGRLHESGQGTLFKKICLGSFSENAGFLLTQGRTA